MADEIGELGLGINPIIRVDKIKAQATQLRTTMQNMLDGNVGRGLDRRLQSIQLKMADVLEKSKRLGAEIVKTEGDIESALTRRDSIEERLNANESQYQRLLSALKEYESQAKRSLKGGFIAPGDTIEKAQELRNQMADLEAEHDIILKQYEEADKEVEKLYQTHGKLVDQQETLNNKSRIYVDTLQQATQQDGLDKQADGAKQLNQDVRDVNRSMMGITGTLRGITRLLPGVSARGVMGVSMLVRGVTRLSTLTREDLVKAIGVVRGALSKLFAMILSNPIVAVIAAIVAAVVILVKQIKKAVEQTKKELEALGKFALKLFQNVAKGAGKLLLTVTKGFMGLGTTVIKGIINGVQLLITKLRSLQGVITENLKSMAQWNEGNNAVNRALSNLTSSLAYVKGALAAAFAPILTVVEPALTSLIDKLAEAINMIGLFIAKLTGATSYQRAIRQQKDFAKSLDGVGKSANSAKQKLADYDKLSVISQDSGGGAGAGAVDWEEITLQDMELPDWLQDLYELGTSVGLAVRDFLNGIPWDTIQDGAKRAAQGISDFVNGILSVQGLGTSVGHTLAQLGNTFLGFANTLLTKIHFDRLGQQLGDAFSAIFSEFHFDEFGDLFSNALNDLATFVENFFRTISGTDVGEAISVFLQHALGNLNWNTIKSGVQLMVEDLVQMLNSLITPENFALIGHTIAETFNTLFLAVGEFVKGAKWKEWGVSIATGIRTLFEEFDAKNAGTTISELALGLLDMLSSAIDELFKDDTIINKIADFFGSIQWDKIGEKVKEISEKLRPVLTKLWNTLADSGVIDDIIDLFVTILNEKKTWEKLFGRIKFNLIWKTLVEKIKQSNFGETIKEGFDLFKLAGEFFDKLKEDFANKDWGQIGLDLLNGIVAGLLGFADIVTSPFQALFDWIWEGICGIFEIHSPSKVMESVGENIILGILEGFGLVDFVGKVQEWWDTSVAPWFTFERWAELGENMRLAMTEKTNALKENLSTTWTNIKENIGTKVTQLKENISTKWDTMKTDVSTKTDSLKTNLTTKFTNLKTTLATTFEGIRTNFVNVWERIKEGIKSPINGILGFIESLVNGIINGINGMVDKLNELHIDVPSWAEKFVGGPSFGFNLSHLANVQLPRLAQGAVIPPNREFAAILGDQKSGTNIETPLDTMIQAFRQALAETGGTHEPVILQLNGKTVAQAVWDEEKKKYKQTGSLAY